MHVSDKSRNAFTQLTHCSSHPAKINIVSTRCRTADVADGFRPCENSNARRARRNILEKLRVLRTDNAADIRLDAMSENCVFYISPMYEFSHSLGQNRTLGKRPP